MPATNMYPNAGGAPFIDSLNYAVPPASLVMPQVTQAQATALPLNQPPVQSTLPVAPGAGFFNTPAFVPQVPQQVPQLPLVQHKPISTSATAQAPAPTIVPVAASVVPAVAHAAAPSLTVAPALAPAPAAAPAIFNRALNNQPVEKEPPANVVITSSDPLPKPAVASVQPPTLSVTIPAQHIKSSLVPATEPPSIASNDFKFTLLSNKKDSNDANNIFKGLATSGAFSFKTQVAQAAVEKQKELAAEAAAHNESAHSEGNQSVGHDASAELDYDPRPDFQGIIPLPDEVEVRTGEEDEVVKFSHRAKLFRHVDKEWKERGIGDIKILKNQSTGCTRILMRREQTHKICANHKITPDMVLTTPEQDKDAKSLLWAANDFADEKLQLEKFLVRFKLPETAKQFKLAFEEAAKSLKSDVPSITFGNVKTSTITSFRPARLRPTSFPRYLNHRLKPTPLVPQSSLLCRNPCLAACPANRLT